MSGKGKEKVSDKGKRTWTPYRTTYNDNQKRKWTADNDNQKPLSENMSGSESNLTHDCNQHYNLISDDRSVVTCDGCKMDAYGPIFVCNLCDNTLHKVCRYPKPIVSHEYFDNSCIFTFNEGNLAEVPCKFCVACGKDVRGFNYYSTAMNLSLHPVCYKLEKKIYFDDKTFNLRNKLVSNCLGCDKIYSKARWAYVSTCNKTIFHVHCLKERVHEFSIKNGVTTNKVETSVVDLNSVFESKIKSEKESITHEQVFMEFLTDDIDANQPKIEEADTTSEPGEMGIYGRISKFFKTMYHEVVSGITLTCQKVWNAARIFFFKITSLWCEKIVDFYKGVTQLSKTMLPYFKEGSFFGSELHKLAEFLHELAKVIDLDLSLKVCEKFIVLLQLISRGPIPGAFV